MNTTPCPCECNTRGGFCGGCGHAGCGGRVSRTLVRDLDWSDVEADAQRMMAEQEEQTPSGVKLLNQIEAACALARAALDDENEGDFARAVTFLESDARDLADLVRSW